MHFWGVVRAELYSLFSVFEELLHQNSMTPFVFFAVIIAESHGLFCVFQELLQQNHKTNFVFFRVITAESHGLFRVFQLLLQNCMACFVFFRSHYSRIVWPVLCFSGVITAELYDLCFSGVVTAEPHDPVLPPAEGGPTWTQHFPLCRQPAHWIVTAPVWENLVRHHWKRWVRQCLCMCMCALCICMFYVQTDFVRFDLREGLDVRRILKCVFADDRI